VANKIKTQQETVEQYRKGPYPIEFDLGTDYSDTSLESLYKSYDFLPLIVAVSDIMDDSIIFINKHFEQALGYKREEIVGKSVIEMGLINSRELQDDILQMARTENAFAFETEAYTRDGKKGYYLVNCILFYKEEKQYLVSLAMDISERILAEKENLASIETFTKAFNNSPVAMILSDLDTGTIFNANRKLSEISGYEKHELIGATAIEIGLITPEDREGFIGVLLEKGKVDDYELDFVRKSGSKRTIKLFMESIIIGNEKKLLTIAEDITERKEAEKALKGSEEKYRTLFEKSNDAIFLVDMKTGIILQASYNAERLLGIPVNDLIGMKQSDLYPPEHASRYRRLVRKFLAGSKMQEQDEILFEDDIYVVHSSGNLVPVDVSVKIMNIEGKQLLQGIFRDITERKQVEEELERSYRLLERTGTMAKVGGWELDTSSMSLYWSTEVRRIHEVPDDYVPDVESGINFYAPEWRDIIKKAITGAIEKAEPFDLELEIITARGNRLWVKAVGASKVTKNNTVKIFGTFQDITERKLTENKILESEKKFRSYIDNAPTGIFLADNGARYLEVNDAACKMTGYSREELLDMSIQDLFSKDSLEASMESFKRLADEDKISTEHEFIKKDGTSGWWMVDAVKISRDRFLGFTTEITDRKSTEKSLRQNELKFRTVFETATDSISIHRMSDFVFVDVNDAFCRISGFNREELIGKRPHDNELWYDEENRQRYIKELKEKGYVANMDAKFRMKDGSIFAALISTSIIQLDGVPHILSYVRNINDLKKAMDKIIHSEEVFSKAFIGSPYAMVIGDLKTNKMLDVNNKFTQLLGYEKDEAVGRTPIELGIFSQEDRDRLRGVLKRDGFVRNHVIRITTKDGQKRSLNYFAELLNINEDQKLLTIAEDITDRLALEEKMVSYLMKKEELLARQQEISHELVTSREQLRSLITHREEEREEERKHISREIHDVLGQDLTALKMDIVRLSEMITDDQEDLLARTSSMFSKVTSTIKTVQKISSALRPEMLDSLGLQAAIEHEIITFTNNSSLKCESYFNMDDTSLDKNTALSLYRVLQESLTNIIRHAEATEVSVRLQEHGGHVVLEVNDNGRGISKDEISAPDSYGMIGMQERANLLNGFISIVGEKEKGTRVMISIPSGKKL
jgi:PAS domain S-box-containing protein